MVEGLQWGQAQVHLNAQSIAYATIQKYFLRLSCDGVENGRNAN